MAHKKPASAGFVCVSVGYFVFPSGVSARFTALLGPGRVLAAPLSLTNTSFLLVGRNSFSAAPAFLNSSSLLSDITQLPL